jgi:hypothetical protein
VGSSGARGGAGSWAEKYHARRLFCVLGKFGGRGAS